MKKIISLFKRDYTGTRQIYNEVVPGAEWVINGEGVATVKIDGTSCLVQDGKLFKRYDAKHGKTPPVGFIPAQDPDPETGHWPGWIEVSDKPEDKWHREAFENTSGLVDGMTYELIGPKVQGNPYKRTDHTLELHGKYKIDSPRTFDALREWFKDNSIEGIVWHHPDGRMVKIKRRDFGYKWPA